MTIQDLIDRLVEQVTTHGPDLPVIMVPTNIHGRGGVLRVEFDRQLVLVVVVCD